MFQLRSQSRLVHVACSCCTARSIVFHWQCSPEDSAAMSLQCATLRKQLSRMAGELKVQP